MANQVLKRYTSRGATVHACGRRLSSPCTGNGGQVETEHWGRRDVFAVCIASIALSNSGYAKASQPVAPLWPGNMNQDDWIASSPSQAIIQNPGVGWAINDANKQLYYPEWMAGTWTVTAALSGVGFPLGQRFISRSTPGVTKASMIASFSDVGAGMDMPAVWQWRFIKAENGRGVIADRIYNTTQQANAMLGYEAVQSVDYNPEKNPTRMSVAYITPRARQLGGQQDSSVQNVDYRKAELFINNRGTQNVDTEGTGVWQGWELYRQVSQAAKQGDVGDYLTCLRLKPQLLVGTTGEKLNRPSGIVQQVSAVYRTAAFLQPQDPLFFESQGKAVAVYDYVLKMQTLPE